MSRIVEWYNAVELSTVQCEKNMLAKEKKTLDDKLQPLISSMTWDKYNKEYIEDTFDSIKDYYDRVMKAQANVQKILSSIGAWGEIPLFIRKDNSTDGLLDIANRELIVANRLRRGLQLNRLAEKIVLDENYRLYFNVPPSCPCTSDSENSEDEDDEENAYRKTQRQQTDTKVDLNQLREAFTTTVVIGDEAAVLYLPYQEYVDEMVGKAIMTAIHIRLV